MFEKREREGGKEEGEREGSEIPLKIIFIQREGGRRRGRGRE